MLYFFSHFAIQILGVVIMFGVLYGISKVRKPKAGEMSQQEIMSQLALVRMTVMAPFMLWIIPSFLALVGMYFLEAYDFWPLLAVLWLISLFYLGWSASFGFRVMFKRNFMPARIAYTKNPAEYNGPVKHDPRVAKRLAVYPAPLRKMFFFLADAKWF